MRHLNTSHPILIPRHVPSAYSLNPQTKQLWPTHHLHPTEQIFEFVDCHARKDTTRFLLQLQKLGPLPDNVLLVTLHYILPNEGIEACRHFLNTHQNRSFPAERICDLIRMILTMNNFSFNNKHYLQVHGTAMGTRMAPSNMQIYS